MKCGYKCGCRQGKEEDPWKALKAHHKVSLCPHIMVQEEKKPKTLLSLIN